MVAPFVLLSLLLFGQNESSIPPIDEQAGPNGLAGSTDPDAVLPPPIAVVPIQDVGKADAPVRLFGDAYAYVQHVSSSKVVSWVEDTGLRAQNVSDKVIVEMAFETLWREVRGANGWLGRRPMFVPLNPGDVWSQPFRHVPGMEHTMSTAEYRGGRRFLPSASVHVTFVRFSDGTTYSEPEKHVPASVK